MSAVDIHARAKEQGFVIVPVYGLGEMCDSVVDEYCVRPGQEKTGPFYYWDGEKFVQEEF